MLYLRIAQPKAAAIPRYATIGAAEKDFDALVQHVQSEHIKTTERVLGASALTMAERRLLPLLCTHLTAAGIAAELFLSPHTIKSQMKSVYRKLEATNRHQAITRARELELIDR